MPPELREALEAAVTEAETPQETQSETTADPNSSATTVEAGDQGNVGASDAAAPETDKGVAGDKAAPEKDAKVQTAPEVAETPEQKAIHRVDRAPASWKKEAKGEWTNLPLNVRQEVYRREQRVNQVMMEAAKNREVVETINKVTAPYQARLQSLGGTAPAIERLLQAEYVLATGTKQQTAQYMAKLIKDYEVDITELDSVLSGQQASVPQQPDIGALVQQQVQQAIAPLLQQQQARRQQVEQQAGMTVEEMALDPKYPFFEDVRDDMADIIELKAKKGLAITLPEAYTIAVQLNPQAASQMKQQATIQTATQQHQQAQRARVASSSVSGAPASGGSLSNSGDGSLRGAIEAAFGNARL